MAMKNKLKLAFSFGLVGGLAYLGQFWFSVYKKEKKARDKYSLHVQIYNRWLENIHDGKKIADYLMEKGYQTIAIYGLGQMGARLLECLEEQGMHVSYAIDKNMIETDREIAVKTMDEDLEPVDAVLVTAVYEFDKIKPKLETKVTCDVLSLEQIVFEM